MFNMAPHGKELSEDLRIRIVALLKDGLGYKKSGNSLEQRYSTVSRIIQRFSKTCFTWNRPRKGRSHMLSPCAMRQMQKLASKNRHMSSQHCFKGCRSWKSACRCSDHTPHTATSRFAWPSFLKEASSEAGSQKSLQTVCWRQPGQEHELLEPCPVVWWV